MTIKFLQEGEMGMREQNEADGRQDAGVSQAAYRIPDRVGDDGRGGVGDDTL